MNNLHKDEYSPIKEVGKIRAIASPRHLKGFVNASKSKIDLDTQSPVRELFQEKISDAKLKW